MTLTRFAVVVLLSQVMVSVSHAEPTGALVDVTPSIAVEGRAKRDLTPDLAIVTLGVTTDRATAAQASADNAKAAAALVAGARGLGLTDGDIRTSTLSLTGVGDARDPSRIRMFRASNEIILRVHSMPDVGSLIGALTADGANAVAGIAFTVEHPEVVLDELRAEAMRDARRKAEIYAGAGGARLGRLLRITPDSAGAPTPALRSLKLQMADAPAPPVEAGTETLDVGVTVVWEVLP